MIIADPTERVRETHGEMQSALSLLADELCTARDPSWDDQGDPEGAGRGALTVSTALVAALVDLLAELELEYEELDGLLESVAQLNPQFRSARPVADLFAGLFAALREISYDTLNLDAFPDIEDCNAALEAFVEEVLTSTGGGG